METNDATLELGSASDLPALAMRVEPDAVHACKIFIIDDEEPNVRLLDRLLTKAGFENHLSTTDSREAAALFNEFQPDLVLTDWLMPHVDGCGVIGQIRELISTDDYLPIVVLSADVTSTTKMRALTAGATDFLTKPFDQIEVLLRIKNLLKARLSHLTVQSQNANLEKSVRQRTIELETALTDLKESQHQVIQQERLAALGTMAGGIAHDFNNALSIIMGFSELLLRDAEHGLTREKATLPLTTIITAAEDAAKIVNRLRDFYRPNETDELHLPIDLNQLIEQAISLTKPRWQTQASARGCEIMVTADAGEGSVVSGDAAEIREVLTNLIFNAVDALPQGGRITLQTRGEGAAVVMKISDNGTGMSEIVLQRCLEPFFTTKGQRGTGLGLAMVFGVVQRHRGTLDIESEVGKGTTFILRLPGALVEDKARLVEEAALARPLHILVVDDQPILCGLVCEYLQDDLHTVEIATSGSQALEKFAAAKFDLVITDHVMPKISGRQLALAVKELNPGVPVILLTGYMDHDLSEHLCPPGVDQVLAKPISRTALRHALAHYVVNVINSVNVPATLVARA